MRTRVSHEWQMIMPRCCNAAPVAAVALCWRFFFLCNKRGLMDQRAHQSNLFCTLVLPPVMLIIFLMAAVIGFFFWEFNGFCCIAVSLDNSCLPARVAKEEPGFHDKSRVS